MKQICALWAIMHVLLFTVDAQERSVKVDFESSSFHNNPKVPYDEPFIIIGETGADIEFVKTNIFYEGKSFVLYSSVWNRIEQNKSETFNIVIPPVLKSNTKYDFEIITYKLLTKAQKDALLKNIESRVRFLLMNNIYSNGKNVVVNKPKEVYNNIGKLISESFARFESKNLIPIQAPSSLVLEELNNQRAFKFKKFFKRSAKQKQAVTADTVIASKVEHLVRLISSELEPYMNSQLVQHYRQANIKSVETDRDQFTLPINFGMYAWDKTASINNTSVNNIDFTPGVGITMPFKNKSQLTSKVRIFDSFGFSAGVLLSPVVDPNGAEFVTPGVNLPVYTGLGFRIFKVVRLNTGVLILGEKGNQGFDNLSVLPTAGLSLEINLWAGIKK